MVTLCLFWCPVNTRTLDDCRFSFPWVQVSVSQTTEYCLYCGLLPCTHSSALCLGHALGEPFLHALLLDGNLVHWKLRFSPRLLPEVAVMAMHACVFSRRCFNRASLAQKFVRLGAHVGAVVLQLADLRRLSLSHTWLCSALLATVSSSALFEATLSCPHALSGPVLRTYVSDSSTQSPDALFSIILKPPTGVFFDLRPATGRRPATDRPSTDVFPKKKKKFVIPPWHLGDANRALNKLSSRLGDWEMPIVPPNFFGTRAKKWGLYVYLSIYIILWTLNTSTTNIPAAATYMTALPRVTTREWFTARRSCCFTRPHSFFPGIVPIHFLVTYAFPSHGGILLSSLRFTHSAYPPLSRGLLLRASSSQNGPTALWWKANRLPRGSGSLDRYMLIAA